MNIYIAIKAARVYLCKTMKNSELRYPRALRKVVHSSFFQQDTHTFCMIVNQRLFRRPCARSRVYSHHKKENAEIWDLTFRYSCIFCRALYTV